MKSIIILASFIYLAQAGVIIPKGNIDENFAKSFLNQFGYYNPNAFDGSSDFSKAIREYQLFNHINASGVLDDITKETMSKPRCGITDKPHIKNNAFHGAKWGWPRKTLTYRFINTGVDMNSYTVKKAVREAFDFWAGVAPLSFSESSGRADMTIGFFKRSHGDNSAFDGPNRVLAHAYFPQNGRIHFDEDEYWTVGGRGGVDFLEVATHEIGHALGLDHTNVYRAVMWPSWTGYRKLSLHQDDINGIQHLYGRRTGGTGNTGTGGGNRCNGVNKNKYCVDWAKNGFCNDPRYNLKVECAGSCC